MPLKAYVRLCSRADLDVALSAARRGDEARHLRERWEMQERGDAALLLAWRSGAVVGHCSVLAESPSAAVRDQLGIVPEIDAMESAPRDEETGLRLIEAAETHVRRWGVGRIGIAVTDRDDQARARYERLGYQDAGVGIEGSFLVKSL